ncbi:MAG TPA: PqqD family protein [Thermodesulfobacteriota bacterium]|nr:PqqD family protein [Thermodesulfobacteriota bacterium]
MVMDLWGGYFRRNKEVVWRTLGDDCILLHLESGIYYTLNEEGRVLWEALDGKNKLAEIPAKIMEQYDVDAGTIQKNLIEIMEDLLKEDLVEYDKNPFLEPNIS